MGTQVAKCEAIGSTVKLGEKPSENCLKLSDMPNFYTAQASCIIWYLASYICSKL